MNINSSPSPSPTDQISDSIDHDHQFLQPFAPNQYHNQVVSSSPSSSASSSPIFFSSAQDHTGFYHHQLYHPHPQEDDSTTYGYRGGSSCDEMKNKVNSGLKLTLWKNKDEGLAKKDIPVKWMSTKMRVMQKMKNTDRISVSSFKQLLQPSSSMETDLSSNSSSYNSNSPIRVCADCNTTKTPLWRSGPKGPKSLCNACGIRQRKARRAMAAAAANGMVVANARPATLKIKVQHKEMKTTGKNVSGGLKKGCKIASAGSSSSSSSSKASRLEEFLINLSNNLAVHRVFPEDEKDAAILLMALSSGLVHG
ncbi:putative GATA transcription factor 22 [Sesamum indicum]|uniref:GATA transcription factor 22 n=1 Tax=Sesamum indicum TaxID=4182 RepID=A0A6I9UHM7_SESIN|nr:putative GATA transcription factor 22 [Sesamum indicum]